MTDPRQTEREQATDPKAEPEPAVDVTVIHDLDALAEDADEIRGGKCQARAATTLPSGTQN